MPSCHGKGDELHISVVEPNYWGLNMVVSVHFLSSCFSNHVTEKTSKKPKLATEIEEGQVNVEQFCR